MSEAPPPLAPLPVPPVPPPEAPTQAPVGPPRPAFKLTGLVIAQDEERDLPRCLESLAFCDERLVIDGGSRDKTVQIAEAAGARVVTHPWPGYAVQRRFGLDKSRGEWILAVDADEVVDEELRKSVLEAVASPHASGYRVRVQNWLGRRRLRFGGVGSDDHLRLVPREGTGVSVKLVHEAYLVKGRVDTLSGALVHHSYASLTELAQKVNRYSSLGALDAFARNRRLSHVAAMARLPWGFFKRYVLKLGFLDGYAGFVWAAMQAYGDFLKGAKIVELAESSDP